MLYSDVYRGKFRLEDGDLADREKLAEAGKYYSNEVARILERSAEEGRTVAAYIAEALQSCGGLLWQ
jgi:4-aminobutyrate aminotransferase-like enzyme